LAAKADGAENVLRVKAATQRFRKETNLSVITEDGSYYTFNVKYADEPVKLSIEMADFLHTGYEINKPGNELPVYLSDLGSESPYLVRLIMETIHKNNRTKIKHIGSKNFGIQYLLKGLYSHNELLFFHFQLKNTSTVSFNVDYLVFRIVDKKVAKRTAIQEQMIIPLRSYNQITTIAGGKEERTVFTLPKFTIPNDKQLVIELTEKDGGRNQTLTVENADLVRAEVIDNLTVKVK
jgi:conjugative transposon TraN protein